MAMLVLDIPSGYIMLQPDANKVVRCLTTPNVKKTLMEEPQVRSAATT